MSRQPHTRPRHRGRRPRTREIRLAAALALAGLVGVIGFTVTTPPAYAAYGQIEGSGSTWSQVIVNQWISDVDANGMKVTYSGGGSSQGRRDFGNNVTDFAISEIPYQGTDEQGKADTAGSRDYAYLPIVAGGTAFTYHLESGGELVRDIRLSGETIAKIFTNAITYWDDAAIVADNNGRTFPHTPITPIVRADGSGTTAQFTTWLDKAYPSIWRPFNDGKAGLTSYYPIKSPIQGANGSDQVMNTVASTQGNGSIAYVEYSYPLNKGYPVVKVLNAAGFYVEPTQYNVAVALTAARINTDKSSINYLTQVLDGVYANSDPRAYPLSSYSYMIIPTSADDQRMSTNKRQTLADFMFYSLCEGQGKAGAYGYSPLPLNLVQAGFEQLAKLGAADPAVDISNRSATQCNNPTFVAGDLSRNHLAEIAPAPDACDKTGAGPCLTQGQSLTAGGGSTSGGGAGTGTGTGTGASTGADGTGGDTATGDGAALIDPDTGLPLGGGSSSGVAVAGATASDIAERPLSGGIGFGLLAAAELIAIILVPGLVARRLRREATA